MAGPTYCERLWCVMEIFVFLHMGGSLDRITIEIIAHPESRETNARQLLTAQFACICGLYFTISRRAFEAVSRT